MTAPAHGDPDSTAHPAGPQLPPRRPTHYLHGASRRQVAHVIEGSHLRLGLLLEVQLLTFDLDISPTWKQNGAGHRGWQRDGPAGTAWSLGQESRPAKGWLSARHSSEENGTRCHWA